MRLARERLVQALLVAVELGAAHGRVGRAPGAVDDLVGLAHERVERVHRQPHVTGQAARGPVVGRVVAPVEAAAMLVRHVHTGRIAHRRGEFAPYAQPCSLRRAAGLRARGRGAAHRRPARRGRGRVRRDRPGRAARSRAVPLPAAHRRVPDGALAAPARARHVLGGRRGARQRRRALAARERWRVEAVRRAGRARAAGDAGAPLRGRHQLRRSPRSASSASTARWRPRSTATPSPRASWHRCAAWRSRPTGSTWATACRSCAARSPTRRPRRSIPRTATASRPWCACSSAT